MHIGFGLFLFVIYIFLPRQTNQRFHFKISRKHHAITLYNNDSLLHTLTESSTVSEPHRFFQNEPIPLAASIVDDLTILASAVYIISLIIIIFVVLAWITHYNALCSSFITSILSTVTGLPEPIIRSVALCGACCIWCESTWLFRRIHHFNIVITSKIKRFVSTTCKAFYDTVCPCCQPPDTPSNRSIIGSLPASIIAMINIPDPPNPLPPKPLVTVTQPGPMLTRLLTNSADSHSQPTTESLIDKQDHTASNVIPIETTLNIDEIHDKKSAPKKRRKQRRKRTHSKQRSMIDESQYIEEQTDDISEDDEEENDEEEESPRIY